MDLASFANELEVHKRRLEAAKAQKGKKATGKPSRSKLQYEHSPGSQASQPKRPE